VIICITVFYLYVKSKMNFWKKRGIAQEPGYFPFGSLSTWDMLKQKGSYSEITNRAYFNHPEALLVGEYGFFGKPVAVIRDLDLAKQILIKDFDNFTDRKPDAIISPHSKNNRYFRKMLIELRGKEWKQTRAVLTPIFTSGKLKAMVPLIHKIADECNSHLEGLCRQNIEGKDLMKRFALDVIVSTGFGYDNNSFKNPNNFFKENSDLLFGGKLTFKHIIAGFLLLLSIPELIRLYDMPAFNKKAEMFFANMVLQSIDERRKSGKRRNDLIDLVQDVMIKEEQKGNIAKSCGENINAQQDQEQYQWTLEELQEVLVSNSLLMFLAGFDTVSTAAGVSLYFLAKHPDYQERLYQEVLKAIEENGGDEKLDYAAIMNLEYMDMFFQESQRMYPIFFLERASKSDYTVPGTDLVIPKGIFVRIATTAIVKDEKIFPNPHVFDPDNFNEERKAARHDFAVGTFGHGPRGCIAKRFAMMEVKLIICKFKILPCDKTVDELIPDSTSRSFQPKGELWFTIEKR